MLLADELFVRAASQMREEEVRQVLLASEARRPTVQNSEEPVWSWRVEPGMEEAFQNLLGWLLSSQRGAEIETAAASRSGAPQLSRCLPACCRGTAGEQPEREAGVRRAA